MQLKRAVLLNGKTYAPGQEDALKEVLPQADLNRLAAKGYIVLDVREGVKAEEPEKPVAAKAPKRRSRASKAKAEAVKE